MLTSRVRTCALAALILTATVAACGGSASAGVKAASGATTAATVDAASGAPTVKVSGNHLVDGSGKTMRLLGINRDGTEYACGEGWGIFDGPNTAASVNAMLKWDINSVRLPLSEACWLGLPGIKPQYSGATYRNAIKKYVTLLHQHGLVVILDLHIATPHSSTEINEQPVGDAAHSIDFWKSVATTFKNDHSVLFDLLNEPHDTSWSCWLNGCSSVGYDGVGYQQLVDAVRSTGATQPLMIGAMQYDSDFSEWDKYAPKDPDHQIVASFHTYGDYPCTASCFKTVAHVAGELPMVTGEFGSKDCTAAYADKYMKWADAHGISYLAWTWNEGPGWDCKAGPTLITNYNGTPTGYGVGVRDHLRALHASGGSGGSTPTPTPTHKPTPTPSPKPTSSGGAVTINDAAGDATESCRDVRKVVASTTSSTVTFVVTMGAHTCGGHGIPLLQIDRNRDGTAECQAIAFNGPSDVRCNNAVTGAYSAKPSASDSKQWVLSFPVSALGSVHSFGFQVVTWTDQNAYSDVAPNNNEAVLKLG